MSLLGIGLGGITTSQTSLKVTGNNIANADIASYSRQNVNVETLPEQFNGSGFIGSGSIVTAIGRVVNEFIITQVRNDTTSFSSLDIFSSNIDQVDSLLADELGGLGPVISNFFASIEASAQDPTSEPARQVVLSEAEGLSQRINTLTDRLLQQANKVNRELGSMTAQISSLASGLAQLNQNISEEIGRASGAQPNQLLDQRDELLRQLSEFVSVTTVSNGTSIDVFIGNGQPLVVGSNASSVGVDVATNDPGKNDIVFIDQNGFEQVVTEFINGGKLGGALEFRDDVMSDIVNSLGRLSIGIADTLNQQNSMGITLDGGLGGNIFRDINDGEIPRQRVIVDTNNSNPFNQSIAVNIRDVSALTTSDYQINIIDLGGDSIPDYQIIRKSDNFIFPLVSGVALASSSDEQLISIDGFDIVIDGRTQSNLSSGDRFYLRPTRSGGSDINVEIQQVQELAYAAPIVTDARVGNIGSGLISSGEVLEITDDTGTSFSPSNSLYSSPGILAAPVLIRFTSATDFSVYEFSDPTSPELLFSDSIVPGQRNTVFGDSLSDGNYIGFQAEISGIPQTGDEFVVGFNANGSSDNRNAVALGEARTRDILAGGSTNFENTYGSLLERIGTRAAQANISREAAQSLLFQSQNSRDSISGVNLDEEAANLIKFEQSYNASAQIINVARQIFDTLLNALG